MNGNGLSRAHGPGLNGAGDFYYEAVAGAQSPGGPLLSPAAFINPAQYASVLEGRFKQLQGERPPRAPTEEPPRSVGRQCARGIINYQRPENASWVLTEWGKARAPWKQDSERGGSAQVSTRGGCHHGGFGDEAPAGTAVKPSNPGLVPVALGF